MNISNQIRLNYSCVDCGADSREDVKIANTSLECLYDGTGLLFLTLLSREPLPGRQVFSVTVNDIMAEATVYTAEPAEQPEESMRDSELYL